MPKSEAYKKIYSSLKKEYLGDKVPSKYRPRYGKRYDKKDLRAFAYAVAKSRGIKTDKWVRNVKGERNENFA